VPMHVDACVGGFILPFMEMNGRPVPVFDYRAPGVTSMSADLHKYGFAAKGASTITYRDLSYFKHQIYVSQDWSGGVFASPALLGTRPGGAYAAAWAALKYFGVDGYRELARRTAEAVDRIVAGVEAIPGLRLLAKPDGPLVAYGSAEPELNIFVVGDQMEARGWNINRLQFPDGLHAMVTARHLEVVDTYLADLAESVAVARAHPEYARQGQAAMYGMVAHAPFREMVRAQVLETFASYYAPGAKPSGA
jgi:sphinganine-1-phosphate aldolase